MNTIALIRSAIVGLAIAFTDFHARGAQEPLFEGLGSYKRKVTTDSLKAQRYFDQGLAFLHGFNHGAAIRSFREAARLDPECAMAHWGIALASGPHINYPLVPPPAAELAWKELELARKYAPHACGSRRRTMRKPLRPTLVSAKSGPKPTCRLQAPVSVSQEGDEWPENQVGLPSFDRWPRSQAEFPSGKDRLR